MRARLNTRGFTIVELLIVIVVIAILAAITIVAFNGVQNRAKVSSIQGDLSNALKKIEVYRFQTSTTEDYPPTLTAAGYSSGTNALTYSVNNSVSPKQFCLSAQNGTLTYFVTQASTQPSEGDCIIQNGLVGWWRLNGDTLDSSGNARHGTGTALTAATGQNGTASNAYTFIPASSSRIDLPTSAAVTGNDPYSLSAWFRTSAAGVYGIVGWGTWGTANSVTALRVGNSPVGLSHYWWSNDQNVSFANVANNQWHHVVATSDGTSQRMYVDGTLLSTRAAAGHAATASGVTIGRTSASEYFNGQLDDVRIYDRTLNQTEVSTLYSAGAQ